MHSPWLIYALGSGWGHLNRAIALARTLTLPATASRTESIASPCPTHDGPSDTLPTIHLLTNSPYAAFFQALLITTPNLHIHAVTADRSPAETRQQIDHWLNTLPYEGLVVDTFPRGLLGELAPRLPLLDTRPRVLIHRDLNPHYVATHHLIPFVEQHYDRIWIPGEGSIVAFAHLHQARHSAPWLVRRSGELPDRPTACALLRLPSNTTAPLVLVLVSGQPKEQAFFEAVAEAIAHTFPHITLRLLSAHPPIDSLRDRWISHYPAMDVLWMASAVIGSGGYNTVHECVALNVPLIAIPWKRLYDRQAQRLERLQNLGCHVQRIHSVPEALTALQGQLANPRTPPPTPPHFENGAIAPEVLQDFSVPLSPSF